MAEYQPKNFSKQAGSDEESSGKSPGNGGHNHEETIPDNSSEHPVYVHLSNGVLNEDAKGRQRNTSSPLNIPKSEENTPRNSPKIVCTSNRLPSYVNHNHKQQDEQNMAVSTSPAQHHDTPAGAALAVEDEATSLPTSDTKDRVSTNGMPALTPPSVTSSEQTLATEILFTSPQELSLINDNVTGSSGRNSTKPPASPGEGVKKLHTVKHTYKRTKEYEMRKVKLQKSTDGCSWFQSMCIEISREKRVTFYITVKPEECRGCAPVTRMHIRVVLTENLWSAIEEQNQQCIVKVKAQVLDQQNKDHSHGECYKCPITQPDSDYYQDLILCDEVRRCAGDNVTLIIEPKFIIRNKKGNHWIS